MALSFADQRKKAAFRSARMTLEEYCSIARHEFGIRQASRSFAVQQLGLWPALSEADRKLCLDEFERLGLIPPGGEVIPFPGK